MCEPFRKDIDDRIFYWKATTEPLSSDVIAVRGDKALWLYDVGDNEKLSHIIEALPEEKNIILSHFHKDHIGNLTKLTFKELYQSNNTYKYTGVGNIIKENMVIDDGIKLQLFELTSSHSKGCIALVVNKKYAFLGDATYCTMKNGQAVYNSQLLYDEIKQLKSIETEYFVLSHDERFNRNKHEVIAELEEIYSSREKNNPYIVLT